MTRNRDMSQRDYMRCLELHIEIAKMRAAQWQTMALTGDYKRRKIFHGVGGTAYTEEELLHDALETAERHIQIANECFDKWMHEANHPETEAPKDHRKCLTE